MTKHKDVAIVVLAAGKGTRLKSSLAKVLHAAGGRPLVEHVVRSCVGVKPKKTIVVVGHQGEKVQEIVEPLGAETVVQQPQNGTGHALLVAKRAIGSAKYALVVPGDAPLVRTETLRALIQNHKTGQAAASILTAVLADPSGYGRIIRKGGDTVAAIVEESQLTAEQQELNEINSSVYCFTTAKLWPALAQVKPNNQHREIYLTDVIGAMNSKGETVLAELAPDSREILGCNTRADLAAVDHTFREWKRAALMRDGVTIQLPETVLIDPDVVVGEDTVIEPCVQLLGKTTIGARCTVKTGCVIHDSVLGDEVIMEPHCVITASRIDSQVIAGPFARMRPESRVKRGAKIGNFVELKKSTVGEGSKVPHLSYIGDAKIGTKTNIGAGTITCNYDGFHKHPTIIGNKAFIGTDTALVAPVRIGDGAYVAAGSTITENVPADALGIARGRQVNKKGWASKKRRELAAAEKPKKHSKKRR
ncbi:MAG TPA: bifunctional UDP-N-acetylglucosamine diphosphorylase/glucosamine-1-phosphate N-acetyltransferase GlmU [Candidatus Eremiobacteraceae bacterium]|nr:bifunctional UDP-N-acetylglucosamine diphosphorylase/glucosamine-1-phosphate N-acetyltransferase GlmU [Candidatus Eremiobacteraceae bacterium]